MKKLKKIIIPALILSAVVLYASMPVSSFIIRPDRLSKNFYREKESRFLISSSDTDFRLPRLSNQIILNEKIRSGRKEIEVTTGDFPLDGQTDSRFLRNTPFLNLESREIQNTAQKFSRAKEPLKEISLFVYNHISDKKEGIPIIPALSILNDRAGDCTEHSILAAALLRANRIPARAVVGIIMSEFFIKERDVFVYHMWVEAWRNGRWEIVDATRPLQIHHNRYIGFTFHNLTTEAPLDYLNAVSRINDVKISQAD